jgi:hypothetical protein
VRKKEQAKQVRFTSEGEVVAEPLLEGDSGDQLALFAPPTQTGESLALETAGPMFAEEEPDGA